MIRVVSLFIIVLFFVSCSTKNLSPVNVSDYFWAAEQSAKLEDAKKFVRQEDSKNVALQKVIKIQRFTFGEVVEKEDVAVVSTTLYLEGILSKAKEDQVDITFDTTLQKTKDGWKVNLTETKKALYIETTKKFTKGLGAQILQKFQEKMGDFKQFQSIFEEMVQGMKKSLQK